MGLRVRYEWVLGCAYVLYSVMYHNNDYQQGDEVSYSCYSIVMARYPMGN